MMDIFTYRCLGSETKSGGNTIIEAPPVSGMVATNLYVNGTGVNFGAEDVDTINARIRVTGLLARGTLVQLLFKKLPRTSGASTVGFEAAGFESAGFA